MDEKQYTRMRLRMPQRGGEVTFNNTLLVIGALISFIVYAHMFKSIPGLWYFFPLAVGSYLIGRLAGKADEADFS